MALITEHWFMDMLLALVILSVSLYLYFYSKSSYWEERKIPYINISGSIFFKCLLGRMANADLMKYMYNQRASDQVFGFYQLGKPTLMIRDPGLIERVLIKDFAYFEDRGLPLNAEDEPLTVSLVNLRGNQWRELRHRLTPAFTSSKLKGMFQQICNCGQEFLQQAAKIAESGEIVDTNSLIFTFTTDVIASCAFGLQIKSEGPEGKKFKDMVQKSLRTSFLNNIKKGFLMMYPNLSKRLGLRSVSPDVNDYFMSLTKATIEHRMNSNIKREDFFELLLALKHQDESGKQSDIGLDHTDQDDVYLQYSHGSAKQDNTLKFTDDLIAAQTFVFLAAGADATSSTLSVTLHYLAQYPEVQARLQDEVDKALAKYKEQWSYEALKDMTYLDQVIQESQRMFPVAYILLRKCTSSYKVPDLDLMIENGTTVLIPVWPIQMDPAYYPDPEVFNPDRFEGNNFKPSAIFSPFGDGPRMCNVMRFAILEMKLFLAKALSRFTVKPSSKTITPLRYDPASFNSRPLGGVWVSFHDRRA